MARILDHCWAHGAATGFFNLLCVGVAGFAGIALGIAVVQARMVVDRSPLPKGATPELQPIK